MLIILGSLLIIRRNLDDVQGLNKWMVKLPFSIYLGWISVATIANASQWLYYYDWNAWSIAPATWAVIMLAIASLLGILMSWLKNDTAYGLVLIWAFVGITVSQAGTRDVVFAAWAAAVAVALSLFAGVVKFKKIY
jgi:hypothetical protein